MRYSSCMVLSLGMISVNLLILAGGRPSADRTWTECFAQLVGTVLSLWDAAQLDAAGPDADVLPTFINLADASIKMVRTPVVALEHIC